MSPQTSLIFSISFLLLSTLIQAQNDFTTQVKPNLFSRQQVLDYMNKISKIPIPTLTSTMDLSRDLALRAFDKTWASDLTYAEYLAHQAENTPPLRTTIIEADKFRFTEPLGETSGWGKEGSLATDINLHFLERISHRNGRLAIRFLAVVQNQIPLLREYIPSGSNDRCYNLDGGGYRAFHSTHAEVKLYIRMLLSGDQNGNSLQRRGANMGAIAVSRTMCNVCRKILAVLARNGKRKLFIATFRNGNDIRNEYLFFRSDGKLEACKQDEPNVDKFRCSTTAMTPPMPGVDEDMMLPVQNMLDDDQGPVRQLLPRNDNVKSVMDAVEHGNWQAIRQEGSCPLIAGEVPGQALGQASETWYTILNGIATKTVGCEASEAMTGLYGSFGLWAGFVHVLKSVGPICEGNKREKVGWTGPNTFEIKCPLNCFVTGVEACVGTRVDKIRIKCTSRIDNSETWKSWAYGYSDGGCCKLTECGPGSFVAKFRAGVTSTEISHFEMACR